MSGFWNNIKHLFTQVEDEKTPAIHETLERTEAEQEAYHHWKHSRESGRLMNFLKRRIEGFEPVEEDLSLDIQFVESPKTNGFVLHFDDNKLAEKDFQFLFDLLRDRIIIHDYRLYMSDSRQQMRNGQVHHTERHYLKPRLYNLSANDQVNQQFGNITLEYLRINGQPQHVKLIVNIYSDYKYTEARPYSDLLRMLVA